MEILQPLIANERLGQFCHTADDVDQIEDHATLGAHHQVEIAQSNIEIDDHHFLAVMGERGAQCSR